MDMEVVLVMMLFIHGARFGVNNYFLLKKSHDVGCFLVIDFIEEAGSGCEKKHAVPTNVPTLSVVLIGLTPEVKRVVEPGLHLSFSIMAGPMPLEVRATRI